MNEIIVNGKKVSMEEFREMQENPNIRLVPIAENQYKVLQKLKG